MMDPLEKVALWVVHSVPHTEGYSTGWHPHLMSQSEIDEDKIWLRN